MAKDIKFMPTAPKTYTVSELGDTQQQPVKKSLLSAAARNKIVNRNQVYQSQNQEICGPCIPFNQNCECNLEELQRQEQILKNKEIEERIQQTRTVDQQNEELQRLRSELETQRADCNDLRNERNNLRRELDACRNQNRVLENEKNIWSCHVCYVSPPAPAFVKGSIIFRCGKCKVSYAPYY